ncbi:MAG: winged helix-turn-helix transcriptional regulator [Candidatus Micrarchaeota archaeon]|nr:winged helix-turn-helix transcriptional regulator [Candidatus Micrarchaeota archaeon]MDE1870593.1 winged helix-turn-helix transcriptional regulator [Candidatus Micrarchaeota archaeon]
MAEKEGALLFKEKQIKILLALLDKSKGWNLTEVSKAAGATYVHTSKFVARCEDLGIIQVEMHGKIKTLTLTPKGSEIADSVSKIVEKMREVIVAETEDVVPPEKK